MRMISRKMIMKSRMMQKKKKNKIETTGDSSQRHSDDDANKWWYRLLATVREDDDDDGVFYLLTKIIRKHKNSIPGEKLHKWCNPVENSGEFVCKPPGRVELPNDYEKALEIIDRHMMDWPKAYIRKTKLKLERLMEKRMFNPWKPRSKCRIETWDSSQKPSDVKRTSFKATVKEYNGWLYLYTMIYKMPENLIRGISLPRLKWPTQVPDYRQVPNDLLDTVELPNDYETALEVIDGHMRDWPKVYVRQAKKELKRLTEMPRKQPKPIASGKGITKRDSFLLEKLWRKKLEVKQLECELNVNIRNEVIRNEEFDYSKLSREEIRKREGRHRPYRPGLH